MSGIISEFYQAYLNAFAPDIYYDTSGPATIQSASITFPVARARVSPLHGIGLAILLFLLAIFMTATLRLQTVPDPQSPVWGFYPATILKHVSMSTRSLFKHLSTDIDSKDSDEEIIAKLRDRRYASDNGTFHVLPVPNPAGNETAPRAPSGTPDCPSDLSRQEEALPAIQEAVGLCRRLAPDRPAAFDLDLAMSLNNVSVRLSNLGCREEALQAIQGSVELYRRLAADHPVIFNHNLAKSLDDLFLALSNMGHREKALQAIQEVVELYRRLAADHPVIFNHNLAKSLDNLFLCLSNLGHREEALQAIQEAVELHRRLEADHPVISNHNFAKSLDDLFLSLSNLGHRREEALHAIQEAVKLYRRLASDYSGVVLDPCDFARSLNNLSSCLSGSGHEGKAEQMSKEAAELS
jgi:tetratricopeptide (TPR) repeat protein